MGMHCGGGGGAEENRASHLSSGLLEQRLTRGGQAGKRLAYHHFSGWERRLPPNWAIHGFLSISKSMDCGDDYLWLSHFFEEMLRVLD